MACFVNTGIKLIINGMEEGFDKLSRLLLRKVLEQA